MAMQFFWMRFSPKGPKPHGVKTVESRPGGSDRKDGGGGGDGHFHMQSATIRHLADGGGKKAHAAFHILYDWAEHPTGTPEDISFYADEKSSHSRAWFKEDEAKKFPKNPGDSPKDAADFADWCKGCYAVVVGLEIKP